MEVTASFRRVSLLVAPVLFLVFGASCVPLGTGDSETYEETDAELLASDQEQIDASDEIALENQAVETELTQEASIEPIEPIEPEDSADALADASVDSSNTPVENAAGQLVGLSIEPLGPGSNMMVVEYNAATDPVLKKTAPSEYVLRLPNISFDANAIGTVVAAPGGGMIRSVRPTVDQEGTLLRIFSNPGVTLESKVGEGKVIVSSRSGDWKAADALAQAAPEKGAEAESAPVITATGSTPAAGTGTATVETSPVSADASAVEAIDETDLSSLLGDDKRYVGRLISLDLQDTDIDNALRIIAEVSNLNIIASDDVTGKVTLRLIDVPWDQALDVILKTNGLDKVQEGNVIRIAPVEKLRQEREALKQATVAQEELEPLQVRYMRVSYAKASELRALVEAVITERGTVAYDERTNQLIIKDISKGVKNATTLVAKLDLRTPQVLLETQIVEASRTLVRDLGARFGFNFVQSPATGNATGQNFPNTIGIDGSTDSPTAIDNDNPIVNILLDSADGTKNITAALSAYESEGRARVISRPAVSTTNNKQATIKSIQRLRVKTPSGGVSVATGQGAAASGTSAIATEQIEVGIVLEVTPQASPDYFVLLDVNAKSSTLGDDGPDGIPIEIERSSTSTVLVSSGQTFAMGGIYKLTDNDNINGVPWFKDIPFLGHLFRDAHVRNGDEELIFFLTPRIIEGSFDDAAMKSSV